MVFGKIKQVLHSIRETIEPVGKFMQAVVNLILLAVVYFIPLGMVSLVSKYVFRKRFLEIKENGGQKSYWKNKNLGTEEMRKYYRMF